MRIAAFIAVFISYILMPWWFALIAIFAYVSLWQGYELLVIAVGVDSLFGHTHVLLPPMYTLMTIAVVVFAAIAKPFISFYDVEA